MKPTIIKAALVLFIIMLAQPDVTGQEGRYGDTPEDSIRCVRHLVRYGDLHRQENFEDALPYWRVLFKEFPIASRNIYIWGVDLMDHMIQTAETEEEKSAYLDTAMMMFDQRIEHYGNEARNLGRKGLFYLRHNQNIEESEPAYEALGESIRLAAENSSPAVIATYMNLTVAKFTEGMFDSEQVIETYSYLMETIESALEKSSNNDALHNARDLVEDMFADCGAADCDALINIFADQVRDAQVPDDADLLNKVYDLLDNANCDETDLYLEISEQLHKMDPSPRSALNISAMYRDRENYDQVVNYLKEAIELQDNPEDRANYYLELAIMADRIKNDRQLSRQYARQALGDNPSLGRAHMHIGGLYASETNCFEGEEDADFKNRTIYWVAVDRFIEAKRADPSLESEADRLIETYSVYFPDNESIFFHGYTEGETYHVGCWINESTRVRAR